MSYGFAGVTVELGGLSALRDMDLEVTPGEVTTVIGADGAGKSTTARTLVGLSQPVSGSVTRPPRHRIGYQPESAGTWVDLTVGENLAFVSAAHGLSARSGRRDELLGVTGLGSAVGRLARDLSGGMRQKLAVAMAMLPSPQLLVLDEATTGLDPISRADLWRLLARAAGEGTAVLVTTSYLDEAERAAQVVVLDEGRVLASGSARSIRESFPGTLAVVATRPTDGRSWRRGTTWRVWSPHQEPLAGTKRVEPDLEDVVTAAALARREAET